VGALRFVGGLVLKIEYTVLLENQGVFQLLEEVTFHCSTVSIPGNFAHYSSASM
jgi:hypothetical protein